MAQLDSGVAKEADAVPGLMFRTCFGKDGGAHDSATVEIKSEVWRLDGDSNQRAREWEATTLPVLVSAWGRKKPQAIHVTKCGIAHSGLAASAVGPCSV